MAANAPLNYKSPIMIDTDVSDDGSESSSMLVEQQARRCTLYLIRHGEAYHNVEEKAAKSRAMEECIKAGLDPNSPISQQRIESARQKVLDDPSFFDAPLSNEGQKQASRARRQILSIAERNNLPLPTEVLSSPLQRTLQTADIVFPDHDNIMVREELRERLTGRPADNRMSSQQLSERDEYQRFQFHHLRLRSLVEMNAILSDLEDEFESSSVDSNSSTSSAAAQRHCRAGRRRARGESSLNKDYEAEDEQALRARTLKLFHILTQSTHETIAVVTHKGYLRGLERGPFGLEDAPEFGNCEVRAYNIEFKVGATKPEIIERLY